ncbi:MAG: ferritin-like domain-containing protein [Planctomycetes bacterium]|nr:ferritin-like domain-containing protein [Planctomycetota bacterium]
MGRNDHGRMIEALNRMLAQEHACSIRYSTHAAVLTGPYAEAVARRLREIAADESEHAEKLRARITALGGTPTMKVQADDLREARTLQEILDVNIGEEKTAIEGYVKILEAIPPSNAILYETIEDVLRDEQEHLEELENLKPRE